MISGENLRGIALDMLMEIIRDNKPSHIVLNQSLSKYQYMDKKERAFLSRLTKGTLERMLTLDVMLDTYSKVKVNKMKPFIRNLLRMSVYQIYFMPQIPDSAACDEAVRLAKKKGFKNLAGFVNGVLRNMSRNKQVFDERFEMPVKDIGDLVFKYSVPEWLCREWVKDFGMERTEKSLKWFLSDRATTVRLCRGDGLKDDGIKELNTDLFKEQMETSGVTVEPSPLMENVFHISGYDFLGALPAFVNGQCTVQDVSSMLAVLAADIRPWYNIIDVCAAPGGKSLFASEYLKDGYISARDLTADKTEKILENIRRLHGRHITVRQQDALLAVKEDAGSADVVLADLPCSGLGVIGRKPDIKYRIDEKEIKALASLQRDILSVVSAYVKSGGTLIYSTCTVSPAENEENFRYLQEELSLVPDSLNPFIPEALHSETTVRGYLQLLPGEYGTDGFFIARLKKQ